MESLTPRERVKIALAHQEPDKIPIDIGEGRQTSIYYDPYLKAAAFLGLDKLEIITAPGREVIDRFDERFLESLDIDFRRVGLRDIPEDLVTQDGGMLRDSWGIGWKKTGYFMSIVDYPLKNATIDNLQHCPWPDPKDERRFKGLREEAEFKHKNTPYCIIAKIPNYDFGVLTQSIYLRGMEGFFMDLVINKDFALELMDKVLEYHMKLYERYLEEVGEFIDIVHIADDLATQTGTYCSLEMFREMIKPKEKRLMALIKNKTEAKILYHTDGAVSSFIDDLIEIGVDILNPIQASAKGMDPLILKESFGDRLSFHGGIDQQRILTRGTVDDVIEEVKLRIKQLGHGGGYILGACQTVVPEVPGENVVQMFRAARQFGNYPIDFSNYK